MTSLDGTLWRLMESRGWDDAGQPLPAPYGRNPIGQISFSDGRMLAALCNGDPGTSDPSRGFSSYGGRYSFDGDTLEVVVDMASDRSRIGGRQVRGVVMLTAVRMLLRPPPRLYGTDHQRRELVWGCVWRAVAPDGAPSPPTGDA
ncbi:lipocalin-like domain-containing protein [Muricoccus pecuniae]|uniref:Lipocalin-like domain-containing protein n=1 Tax=Muricoccus pecuniae TaxID=693023 RepID=A0A840Y8H4_9PROT|nr:lipocalin-like domain-containing protein [Roseomonas pecuniae]MBB5696230.1 hypothetical protein [Roseomonas pecuniae]